ncbi:MAG: cell division protein ZapA [Bacteroidaceae bacterium]|nr:cell division protein ZapA [Bacteroidaceae bacterium]
MEDRELGINLIIDGTSYPLTVKASEEPYYRKAAQIVSGKLSTYKDLFMGEGGVRVMTMVALDIAFDLVTHNDEVGSAEVMHKINELTRLIDNTLAKK